MKSPKLKIAVAAFALVSLIGIAQADILYFSQQGGDDCIPGQGGVQASQCDVVRLEFDRDPYTLNSVRKAFDGASLFSKSNENIDALSVLSDGLVILSTTDKATLGGLDKFQEDDLVLYDSVSDQAELFLRGSDLFAAENGNNSRNIDALYVLDDDEVIVSFADNATRVIGEGGDLLTGIEQDDLVWVKFTESDGSFHATDARFMLRGADIFSNEYSQDIDGVHYLGNNRFLLSTGNAVTGLVTRSGEVAVNYHEADVFQVQIAFTADAQDDFDGGSFSVVEDSFSLYFDHSDDAFFGNDDHGLNALSVLGGETEIPEPGTACFLAFGALLMLLKRKLH